MRGQTVLITGGSVSGLALAEEFAQFWSEDRNLRSRRTGVARARRNGRSGRCCLRGPCDVSKPEEVDNLISSVTRHMGEIDVLVNNAGVISVGPILSQELKDFQKRWT